MRSLLLLVTLAAWLLPWVAAAQDVDALWSSYEDHAASFAEESALCDASLEADDMNEAACTAAAESGQQMASVLEELITFDTSLSDEELESAVESVLVSRQVSASYLVELGRCSDASRLLQRVLDNPVTASSPRILTATDRWMARAEECLAEEGAASSAQSDPVDTAPGSDPTSPPTSRSGLRTAGWVVAGVGVAALGGGLIMYGQANSLESEMGRDADEVENAGSASEADELLGDWRLTRNDAQSAATTSNVLYGVGFAALATGVTLIVISGSRGERQAQSSLGIAPNHVRYTLEF